MSQVSHGPRAGSRRWVARACGFQHRNDFIGVLDKGENSAEQMYGDVVDGSELMAPNQRLHLF